VFYGPALRTELWVISGRGLFLEGGFNFCAKLGGGRECSCEAIYIFIGFSRDSLSPFLSV
jgi:hypothetical protein